MKNGEELVEEPFQRLIAANELVGYQYERWWCMDTFKEHQVLTEGHPTDKLAGSSSDQAYNVEAKVRGECEATLAGWYARRRSPLG